MDRVLCCCLQASRQFCIQNLESKWQEGEILVHVFDLSPQKTFTHLQHYTVKHSISGYSVTQVLVLDIIVNYLKLPSLVHEGLIPLSFVMP